MITFRQEINLLMRGVARYTDEQMQAQARAVQNSAKMSRIRQYREGRESKTSTEAAETLRSRIVGLLRDEGMMSGVEVARRLGMDRGAVYKHMSVLVEQERIIRHSATRYEVAQ